MQESGFGALHKENWRQPKLLAKGEGREGLACSSSMRGLAHLHLNLQRLLSLLFVVKFERDLLTEVLDSMIRSDRIHQAMHRPSINTHSL